MLALCEAQMESALSESDVAVEALDQIFRRTHRAGQALGSLKRDAAARSRRGRSRAADGHAQKQMAAAVVAFQFYDKLTQRLGHVRYSLSALAMFVCDRTQGRRARAVAAHVLDVAPPVSHGRGTQIFKMMVEGASAEEAREHIQQSTLTLRAAPTGEIEIF